MDDALREKIANFPAAPGVYIMKDKAGRVVYVGKSVSLRHRVRSYFAPNSGDTRMFVPLLDSILGDIEIILTNTNTEAVLLENTLIKKHHPRYNVELRDDKNFLSLRLDLRRPWPLLEVVRRPRRDGARYFGPYASATAIRQTLRVLNKYSQLRTCPDNVLNNRTRPCLQYQIKRCPAPCVLPVPAGEYAQSVQRVILFLEGRSQELGQNLQHHMELAASELRFEDAARYRDQMRALQRVLEKQQTVSAAGADRDVFGLYREGDRIVIQLLTVRGGKLQGGRPYAFKGQELPNEEVLGGFLDQYYHDTPDVPAEVLLPIEVSESAVLTGFLRERHNRKVEIKTPHRGELLRLVEMAAANAKNALEESRRREAGRDEALAHLQRELKLAKLPRCIECFDISNIQGSAPVASRVAFQDGEPDKSRYRKYAIKSLATPDDFAMMFEVLHRRLTRGLAENDLPDLIVVDGGKGQLNVACEVLKQLAVTGVDVVGLAKSRRTGEDPQGGPERSPERVFLPGRKDPVILRQNSAALFVLTRLRDESHRFAITFHRHRRTRMSLRSQLEDIPGVGPKRAKDILRRFTSVKAVRDATPEMLSTSAALPKALAETIIHHLRASAADAWEDPAARGAVDSEPGDAPFSAAGNAPGAVEDSD